MKLVKKTQAETSRQRWMVIKKGVEDGQKKVNVSTRHLGIGHKFNENNINLIFRFRVKA